MITLTHFANIICKFQLLQKYFWVLQVFHFHVFMFHSRFYCSRQYLAVEWSDWKNVTGGHWYIHMCTYYACTLIVLGTILYVHRFWECNWHAIKLYTVLYNSWLPQWKRANSSPWQLVKYVKSGHIWQEKDSIIMTDRIQHQLYRVIATKKILVMWHHDSQFNCSTIAAPVNCTIPLPNFI